LKLLAGYVGEDFLEAVYCGVDECGTGDGEREGDTKELTYAID